MNVKVSVETSSKYNMIQDMINFGNMNATESTIPNIFKTIKEKYGVSTPSKCRQKNTTKTRQIHQPSTILTQMPSQ